MTMPNISNINSGSLVIFMIALLFSLTSLSAQNEAPFLPPVAIYELDSYTAYVEVSPDVREFPQRVFASVNGSNEIEGFFDGERAFVFSGLDVKSRVVFYYYNDISSPNGIGVIEVNSIEQGMIPLSASLHLALKDFKQLNPAATDQDLYDFILNLNHPHYEKLGFLQKFFLEYKRVVSSKRIFEEVLELIGEKMENKCGCRGVTILPEFELTPGDIMNATANGTIFIRGFEDYFPDPIENEQGDFVFEEVRKVEFFGLGAGPTKLFYSYSDGYKENHNEWYGISTNGSTVAEDPNDINVGQTELTRSITQTVSLYCTNINPQEPEECTCEKSVRANFFYESQVETRAFTHSSSGGNKRSVAIGEDVAIAYYMREVINSEGEAEPQVIVLRTAENRESNTCNANANNDWQANAVGTVLSFAGLAATFWVDGVSSSNNVNVLRGQIFTQLVPQVTGLINNLDSPLPETNDCGATIDTDLRVIPMGTRTPSTLKLLPDQTIMFGINSGARMVNRGMRSWESEVSIRSNFALTVEVPGGRFSGSNNSSCCSPESFGFYWNRSFLPSEIPNFFTEGERAPRIVSFDPPSDQIEIRSRTARILSVLAGPSYYDLDIDERGDFTVNFDYASVTGRDRLDQNFCLQAPPNDTIDIYFPDNRGNIVNGDFEVKSLNSTVVNIYDINGALVINNLSVPTGVKLTNSNIAYLSSRSNINIPSGVYFVVIWDSNKVPITRKIIIQ